MVWEFVTHLAPIGASAVPSIVLHHWEVTRISFNILCEDVNWFYIVFNNSTVVGIIYFFISSSLGLSWMKGHTFIFFFSNTVPQQKYLVTYLLYYYFLTCSSQQGLASHCSESYSCILMLGSFSKSGAQHSFALEVFLLGTAQGFKTVHSVK